ncbi:hypothetical protein RhiirC2_794998 [Rhizophagus irregularis]|uniref:Helitron helicase-like domain-containing protein n=1 Tax=Rhizophagus irregularis TaxID=588596 RepID=A0A2N1MCF8_9GLOM|nr:hypothetical protein RhiirC2_794998 [Rhizophagus irregularis]
MASTEETTVTSETSDDRQRRLCWKRQSNYRRRHNNNSTGSANNVRHDLGRMDQVCAYCDSKFWMKEKDQRSTLISPTFTMCCAGGKVTLPPLLEPPSYLMELYTSSESDAKSFRKNIRRYNSLLACTSFGANVNDEFQNMGISNFSIHGQVYHLIGPLLPEEGQVPKFAQLYIYDTENEIKNRLNIMTHNINSTILQNLQNMLDLINPYIQNFRQA